MDARVRLRPETRAKWEAIIKAMRWTFTETAEALADEFMERHGITLPVQPDARQDPVAAAG